MQDKTNQILEASIRVFMDKGYKGASTKAIAEEADVAEVTIYRKFNNKRTLFEATLRRHLMPSFTMERLDALMDTRTFFTVLFEDRIEVMSKHRKLMRLVIRESLSENLPEDLRFVSIVHNALNTLIEKHIKHHRYHVDPAIITRTVVGILISYILFPPVPDFNAMGERAREKTITAHVDTIHKLLETSRE